jgi:DNA-binding NtrC family response regulator
MASILVIHDRRDICDLLCPVIESGGHECVALPSCVAALESLRTSAKDIVILDIDSTENPDVAIRSLVRSASRPCVLAMSKGLEPETLERAIRAGAWDVVCMPATHDELMQAVGRCLFHRRARSAAGGCRILKRDAILGTSSSLERCLEHISTASQTNASVLLLGETGTGKELFANAIHANSARSDGNFIVVDCTNIPKTLAESLLFGHERGSFTGAADTREGLFKQADGGTIFLDEIGDLDFEVQKSLLRVLQDKRFRPLSSKREITSDFRLVAATNCDLGEMVDKGLFRKDLYHRLCSMVIKLPPLRERREDILPIANFHIGRICEELGCPVKEISYELHHALTLHDWPGNVRELINTLHAAVHNGYAESRLYPQHLPMDLRASVLAKRNGRHSGEEGDYLIASTPCTCGLSEDSCLLGCHDHDDPEHICPRKRSAEQHAHQVAGETISGGNGAKAREASPSDQTTPTYAAPHYPTQAPVPKSGNGFSQLEGPFIPLSLTDSEQSDDGLLPLGAVRDLAMQEVEALYMQQLVSLCRGDFKRAQAMSGLSRARLYDLLKKHSLSISGNSN